MKNILGIEFMASEQFSGDLTVNQRSPKGRRESVTPKIVVCPPMEETSEQNSMTRGNRLLKALSRRLSRRAADADSLGSSSSNDSVSSDRIQNDSSCSVSDSGSDGSDRHRRHRSTVSLRRVFQSLSISSRSQSCDRQRQPKKQQQPKRILRPPVTYTYVRGLSGLPTQRVPRHTVGCAR